MGPIMGTAYVLHALEKNPLEEWVQYLLIQLNNKITAMHSTRARGTIKSSA